jgi:putative transposase
MEATMTVAITRSDLSASELREAAARLQDAKAARRMLAIALVLEGWSREAAAEACAMDRQTLRDWVHRYNADGLEGLFNQPRRNGPPPRLSAERLAKLAEWVEQGPDFEHHGVVRWRCVDLQQRIREEFSVQLHESTVGKLLRKLSFRHMSVRPQHPHSKPDEHAVFSASFLLL